MNYPSVKTLTSLLKLTKEQAKLIRLAMENNKGLAEANSHLNGFGIEQIALPEGSIRPTIIIDYVNMGDTYRTTLMKVNGRYRVGCWGDIVERFS